MAGVTYKVAFLISPAQHDWRLKLSNSLVFLELPSALQNFSSIPGFSPLDASSTTTTPCWQPKLSPNIAKYLVGAKSPPVKNHWYKGLESHVKIFGLYCKIKGSSDVQQCGGWTNSQDQSKMEVEKQIRWLFNIKVLFLLVLSAITSGLSQTEFYNAPIIFHDYVYLCVFVHLGSQNLE